MTKLGYHSGKWQLRYFVLTDAALNYYNDTGGKLKGSVPVPTILGVQVKQKKKKEKKKKKKRAEEEEEKARDGRRDGRAL